MIPAIPTLSGLHSPCSGWPNSYNLLSSSSGLSELPCSQRPGLLSDLRACLQSAEQHALRGSAVHACTRPLSFVPFRAVLTGLEWRMYNVKKKDLLEKHIDALNSLMREWYLILTQHYCELKNTSVTESAKSVILVAPGACIYRWLKQRNVQLIHKTRQHRIREHETNQYFTGHWTEAFHGPEISLPTGLIPFTHGPMCLSVPVSCG